MKKLWCGTISMMLVVVMLINMLPMSALAIENNSSVEAGIDPTTQEIIPDIDFTEIEQIDGAQPAYVVDEDLSKRSEFYKEFILSNGLRLATIYPDAVHYEDNGQWKEIDNTLAAQIIDGQNVYTNTSGLWDVCFPQRLSGYNSISITKDGFTVSFGMAGEMRSNGDVVVASIGNELQTNTSAILPIIGTTIDSLAQVQKIDTATAKAEAEYAEIIPEKLHSRLLYPSVYTNTNIVYDLQSNQVKESIILQSFDSGLMGYRYTLNTGGLIPVLNDDQSINLCNPDSNDIVMTMPAPFMLDANDEYCEDITVSLVQRCNSYILSYHLPVEWLSAEDRAWPVVLDPIVSANNATNNIQDITVAENGVESNNEPRVKCGYHPTLGICRFYLRFKTLPTLPSSRVIVKANITLTKNTSSSLSAPIEVHKVDAPWEASQTNWSNKPNYQSNIEDVVTVEDGGEYTWDITDIAFGWYSDTQNALSNNTGMLFKAANDVETAQVNNWQQLCSSDHTLTRPVLTITYIDTNGLESYWDTTSNSAGRAGTGYIQPYSGNLTWVHTDIGFDGNRMPVSISHIYNASEASSGSNLFGLGIGWRTNYNQRILDPGDGTLIWEDGDGTPHVFINSFNNWKDTDDLGLNLSYDVDIGTNDEIIVTYTITDKYGNQSEFVSVDEQPAYLTKQISNQPAKSFIEIIYTSTTSSRISKIIDGARREYRFVYGSDGLLDKIEYYGVSNASPIPSISFAHTSSKLTTITYPAETPTTSSFAYTSKNLLSSVTDVDGYKISYTYNTLHTGKPSRVVSVSESAGGQVGNTITFDYTFNRTILTDISETDNSVIKTQTYFFNCCGNTVSIQDNEGRATFYQYQTDDPNNGTKNRLLKASQQQDTVVNLIKDHSFEKGTVWTTGSSSSTCTGIVDTSTGTASTAYLGTHSLLSAYSGYGKGVSGASSGTYSIAAGTSVTFSAYVKLLSGSVLLRISGSPSGYASSDILGTPNEWTRLEATYTNNTDSAVQITIDVVHVDPGSAYIDCVQLEKTAAASRYNLLEDADIWDASAWGAIDSSPSAVTTWFSYSAPTLTPKMMKLSGYATEEMYVLQSVNISGKENDVFTFGAWLNGNASANSSAIWKLELVINNTDNTKTSASILPNRNLPDAHSWQYVASSVTAVKPYNSVSIRIVFGNDPNDVYADGLQLFREPFAEEYKYDGKGNVTETIDILGQSTKYTYDSNTNDLLSVLEPTGIRITNAYDAYHRVNYSVKKYKIGTSVWELVSEESFTYDQYGNITEHTYRADDSEQKSTYGYTSDGNFLSWIEDSQGQQTYYGYNTGNSTLEWIQYPNDTVSTRQTFVYDENTFNLVQTYAYPDQDTLMYALYDYTNDRLTEIETDSTLYELSYNGWGQRTSITAGNKNLATYTYTDDANRYLSQLDYGNGDVVKYVYDDLGRVMQESYYENGSSTASRTVTYTYDSTGALATTSDSKTGRTTKCYYDTVGRVNRQRTSDSSIYHNLYYTYDDLGQVSKIKETFKPEGSTNTVESVTKYSYANGHVTSVSNDNRSSDDTSDDIHAVYSYDKYDRITRKITAKGPYSTAAAVLDETLSYNALNQVTALVLDAAGFDRAYTYEYDGNGNIKKIIWGGKSVEYFYDSQNQLIRENNQITNRTWIWKYDAAGNILSESEYAYSTSPYPTQGYFSYSYQYGNTAWGDLLTNYNGKAISYDAIGNPLSDGTWTYTWEQGRQLVRMSYAQNVWNFTYDSNGMRTGRSNAGTGYTYTYVYNGSQLSRMTYGSNTMWFTYGADGKPLSINYNGTTYYYVTNLQGDVVAILDSAGAQVVGYTYDAWGKLLTTTGSMASTLGLHNPLRYRGYIYDRETELYYLQSRYYNPEWGRFINADSQLTSGLSGCNLFAYCQNNPVNACDPTGTSPDMLYWWTAAMSWLPVVDTALPIGDLIYLTGVLILLAIANEASDDFSFEFARDEVDVAYSPPSPDNDDDDDYYDDDENFGGRQRVGKSNGKTPRNNQAQNKQFRDATKKLSKDARNRIHREYSHTGAGFHELADAAEEFLVFVIFIFSFDD